MAVLGGRLVARTEATVLQANEISSLESFQRPFGVEVLLLLFLRIFFVLKFFSFRKNV
jgi:hypothetical protein